MRKPTLWGLLLLGTVLGAAPRAAVAEEGPRVRSVSPTTVLRGQTTDVVIEGSGLFPAEEIKGTKPEMGMQIVVQTGSNPFKLLLRVTIAETAPQGPAPILIQTSKGKVTTEKLVVKWRSPIVHKARPDVLARGGEYDVTIEGLRLAIVGQETKVSVEAPMTVRKVRGTETSMTVHVLVPPETPPGPKAVAVETTDGRATAAFTVALAPPVVTAVTPPSRDRGTTGDVVLKGRNLAAARPVALATADADVGLTPKGPPTADAIPLSVSIDPDAAPGPRLLLVQTPDGFVSATLLVTVAGPTLASVTPAGAARGTTTDLTLKGDHLGATPVLRILPADPSVTVASATKDAPATVTVAPGALLGPRTLVAETRDGIAVVPFSVNARGPTVTGIAPNDVAPGATVDLAVDGQGLEDGRWSVFPADPAVVVSPSGTPGRVRVEVKADAVPGPRALLVQTGDGAAVAHVSVGGGSVSAPVASGVTPVRVARGAEAEIVLAGINLRARGDKPPEVAVTQGGVEVPAALVSATPSEVRLRVKPQALGTHAISVRTPDGATAGVFQVVPAPPAIAAVAPDRLPRAGKVEIRVTGTNLLAAALAEGATPPVVSLAGPSGSPAIPLEVVSKSATEWRLSAVVPPSTPPGPFVLTLRTDDGGAAVALPLPPAPPSIEAVSPGRVGVPAIVEFAVSGAHLVQPDGAKPAVTVTRVGAAASVLAQVLEAAPDSLRLRITTPPGTQAGPHVLLVKTADGVAAALFTVADVAPPTLTAIDAAGGTRLGTFLTRLRGTGLAGVTEVIVSGKGVVATVLPGATDRELPVKFEVAGDAAPGARTLTIVGPGGAASNEKVTFTVQ